MTVLRRWNGSSWEIVGASVLDGVASDIQPLGPVAATGSVGKAADAGHVHPNTGVLSSVSPTLTGTTTITRIAHGVNNITQGAGAFNIDASLGDIHIVTLTGNAGAATITNPIIGQEITLEFKQDATGNRTYSWPASIVFLGAGTPTALTAAGARDTVNLRYNGTNWVETARGQSGTFLPLTGAATVVGPLTLATTPTTPLIISHPGSGAGEFLSIEAQADTTQPGNSGTHLYQGDQDFEIGRGLHVDLLLGAFVFDDPTVLTAHLLYEFGEAGYQQYVSFPAAGSPPGTVTISIASPGVVTRNNHGLAVNDPVYLTTTGALPAGLTATAGGRWPAAGAWQTGTGTLYYVKTVLDANTFTLSATPGGAAINTSGTQSGVHTLIASVPVATPGRTATSLFRANKLLQTGAAQTTIVNYVYSPTQFVLWPGMSFSTEWADNAGNVWGWTDSGARFQWYGPTYASASTLPGTSSFNVTGNLALGGQAAGNGGGILLYSGTTGATNTGLIGPHATLQGGGNNYNTVVMGNLGYGVELYANGAITSNPTVRVDSAGNTTLTSTLGTLQITDAAVNINDNINGSSQLHINNAAASGAAVGFYTNAVLKQAVGSAGYIAGNSDQSLGLYAAAGFGIKLFVNGVTTPCVQVTSAKSVVLSSAALATTATDGFTYLPTCAGTPTGVPTTQAGTVPAVVDTTANKVWFYLGGAWKAVTPA